MRPLSFAAAVAFAVSFGVAAKADVSISGSFVARQACPALQSIHSGANPGDIALEPNHSYNLISKNKDDATYYRVEIPGASPAERWVPVGCGEIAGAAGGAGQSASAGASASPTQQPIYLLVASWEPSFCHGHESKAECQTETADSFAATHFTLHGLWRQPEDGESFCNVDPQLKRLTLTTHDFSQLPMVDLSQGVRQKLAIVMPGVQSSLERHEWVRHGTCAEGASPDAYFSRAIALMDQLNGSKLRELFANNVGGTVDISQIKTAMDQSFGAGAGDRVEVHCQGQHADRTISELWFDLSGSIGDQPSLAQLMAASPAAKTSCPSGLVAPAGH